MTTLREQILAAQDLASETVEVPEWGVTLTVQDMSGTQRDARDREIYLLSQQGREQDNWRSRLLVWCLREEPYGPLIFRSADELGGKDGQVLDRLYDVAARLSGINVTEVREELGKGPSEPSGADSPTPSGAPSKRRRRV